MAVAMGCGTVFLTPVSHPVNVFVMGPGGYSFKDFIKVGLPLTLLVFVATMVILPVVWPLR
jgi:di/tricarboxylate transporter